MGAYLSQPKTTKESTDHDGVNVRCGASSMQGWRITQEDAHNCILEFDKNASLFAVYDGHGGHEVAEYCAKNLPDFLKQIEHYKNGNYEEALKSAFIEFDATLATPEILAELKVIAKGKKDDNENSDQGESDSEGEEAIDNLVQEAHMPLDEVMAKYKGAAPQLRLLKGEGGKPPMSPMLRARRSDEAGASGSSSGGSSSAKDVPSSSSAGASSSKSHCGDAEVSSSSSNAAASSLCNGDTHMNGELEEEVKTEAEANAADSSIKKVNPAESETGKSVAVKKCNEKIKRTEPDSSGLSNGETHNVSSSSEDGGGGKGEPVEGSDGITSSSPPKKVSSAEIYQKLLQEESDSEEEEDETFTADQEDSESSDEAGEGAEEKDDDDEEDEDDDEEESSVDEDGEHDDHGGFGGLEKPGLDSGCTAVVSLLVGSELFVANAGDSRCVVCRDGQAIDMSVDHKPEDKLERDRIEAAGGSVTYDGRVNGGLNLSRAIGDHSYKQSKELPASEQMITALPDIQRLTIDPAKDEFMVLACDGIWNSMTSQEVVDFVRVKLEQKTERLSQICEELFDCCLAPNTLGDGTGCDNMTCVIVHFKALAAAGLTSNKRSAEQEEDSEAQPSKKSKVEGETGSVS